MRRKIGPFPCRTRLMQMLYDHPMTLEEVGEIFGVSWQRIQQKVKTRDRSFNRGKKRDEPVPVWLMELVEEGALTATDAARYWGVVPATVSTRCRANLYHDARSNVRAPALQKVWQEVQRLVIVQAWNKGASLKDLAEILDSTVSSIGVKMHRMRAEGYCLPKRRGAGKAAS